ncbi:MAG: hypothetical protein GQ569_09165 [Methylococcaceae bacterium]|nr:hypothetical protein [Methylococcaceae bacterium]
MKNPANFPALKSINKKKDAQTTKLSGVEKYLAEKQHLEDEKIKNETATLEKLTGVAKYLAKKQQEEQAESEAEAAALANMTGVARYLFKLETQEKKTPAKKAAPVKEEKTARLSRVDQYLAKQQAAEAKKAASKTTKKTAKKATKVIAKDDVKEEETSKVEEKEETVAVVEQQETTIEVSAAEENKEPAVAEIEEISNETINLAEGATQCQAATVKGSQCKRKANLEVIEHTVNENTYQFAVCRQHNNDAFTPFAELVQKD